MTPAINQHPHRLAALLACAVAGIGMMCAWDAVSHPAQAQVSALTPEEKSMRGPPGGGAALRARTLANAPKPDSDPRDFAGSYTKMGGPGGGGGGPGGGGGGGGTGGGGGGGGGGGPGGGGPGGGAPGGAGPGGAGPGAGGPGGGAPGGAPGGVPAGLAGGPGANDDGRSRRYCMPSFSQLGGVEGGVDLLQTKNELTIVGEEMHVIRHIYITDHHDPNAKPSYMGDSIAHWEGNTLVVETTKMKQGGTITERISKNPDGSITDATVRNGQPMAGPGGGANVLYWAPGNDPMEWICEDFSDNYMKADFK